MVKLVSYVGPDRVFWLTFGKEVGQSEYITFDWIRTIYGRIR